MTLFAKVITQANLKEIKELNGGADIPLWTLNDNTFYVYGEYHADVTPRFLQREDFELMYRWQDRTSDDNIVVKR